MATKFEIRVDPGKRQLTVEEATILKEELPQIKFELKRRFGDIVCDVHGPPEKLVTILEVENFPDIGMRFDKTCCEEMDKKLWAAANE